MNDFFVDKFGNDFDHDDDANNDEWQDTVEDAWSEEDDFLNKELDSLEEPLHSDKKERKKVKKNDISLNNTYLITSYKNPSEVNKNSVLNLDKILEKSAIKPGLEKQHVVPLPKTKKFLKLERKKLRKKTKGKQWFDMPAAELTKEVMADFKVLKMRSVLDRTHVYKKNDITRVPKYFQVGTIVEGPADFYGGRIPKSQRKKTLVDELLADAEFQRYQKKKFKEIVDENRRKRRTKKSKGEKNNKKRKQKSQTKNNK